MDRKEYLTKIWKAYPAMPKTASAGNLLAGRIFQISQSAGTLDLILLRDQKKIHLHFEQAPEFCQFLEQGDLLAVTPFDGDENDFQLEVPKVATGGIDFEVELKKARVTLLAPKLSSLPARFYNQQILIEWNKYLQTLRNFFLSRGFVEVRTPALVQCPGTEPSLDVFSSDLKVGSKIQKVFLPTSPELHLKKVLSLGGDKIFELAPCFRNGEITERHQPEFLMLEWYRAYDDLASIKKDVIDLILEVASKAQSPGPKNISTFSVSELFAMYCDFNLTPQTTLEELKELGQRLHVDVNCAESIDDYFFLIFMEKIESQLPPEDLIFVEKYPPYQAALARLTEDGWGDRFEAYWKGMELCNAFNELNDPRVQRQRSQEDVAKKMATGKEAIELDEEFFQCLEAGMPPSGGIALGVERLFMALQNITQLSELRVFPR